MKYTIKDNQAGFVLKDGIFKKMITAGTYHFSKTLGYEVEIEEMTGELDYIDVPYQVLSKDKEFLKDVMQVIKYCINNHFTQLVQIDFDNCEIQNSPIVVGNENKVE